MSTMPAMPSLASCRKERTMTKEQVYHEIFLGATAKCKDCDHLGHRNIGPGQHECWHHGGFVVYDHERACPQFVARDKSTLW